MSSNIELFEDLNHRLASIVAELADLEGDLKRLMKKPKQLKRVYWAIRIRLPDSQKRKQSIKNDFYYCDGPHSKDIIGFDFRTELTEAQVPLALKQVKEHCSVRFGGKTCEVKAVKVKVYVRAV